METSDLHMTLVKEYDLLDNKMTFISLNIISIFLFFFFLFLFTIIGTSILGLNEFGFSISSKDSLYFIPFFLVSFFVVICIHELIHGFFSKVFNKEATIRYGFKKGCPYATAPGAHYSRGQFTWICLAPFVLITFLLILLVSLNLISISLFVLMASMHASGCTGDFFFALILFRHPGKILVEDTNNILMIYSEN